jgi:hypothetical protein
MVKRQRRGACWGQNALGQGGWDEIASGSAGWDKIEAGRHRGRRRNGKWRKWDGGRRR